MKGYLSFKRDVKYWVDHILNFRENRKRGTLRAKGDVTRDDLQRRFLTQHSIRALLQHCFE